MATWPMISVANKFRTGEPPAGQDMTYAYTTYGELLSQVEAVATSLRELGLKPNSIVCFYGPTSAASVILLLAVTSIGAIWSSAAADFGSAGVLERFEQFVTPDAHLWGVVGVESVRYNGKVLDQRPKFEAVVEGLEKRRAEISGQANGHSSHKAVPKLEVVVVDYLKEGNMKPLKEGWRSWDDFMAIGKKASTGKGLTFYQAPFDHPLWVLFSSGTTGKVRKYAGTTANPDKLTFTSLHSRNLSCTEPVACCCSRRKSMFCTEIWTPLLSTTTIPRQDG